MIVSLIRNGVSENIRRSRKCLQNELLETEAAAQLSVLIFLWAPFSPC